jgi:hypothetical protein
LGEAFDFLWVFGDFVGFDCSWTGLEWKIDESFRGLGFFSSGWIEQSRPTQLGSKGQFSGTGKRDLSRKLFADSRKWLEFLGLFALFESPPALLPPDFHAMIFPSSRVDSSDETSQNSRHFQGPSKPSNCHSAAEKIAQNPSKLPAKKSSGKIALTIEHFHDSSKQKRAIKNFRFFVNFSSSDSKSVAKCFFLTPCINHKIPDSRNENEISWEFLSNFFDNFWWWIFRRVFHWISNIPEQKHSKDPYPSLTSPRPMSAVFAAERKTIEDQRKEEKTLAWLIISADFLQGKSALWPSVFLGFWSSEGRTQILSSMANCQNSSWWKCAQVGRHRKTFIIFFCYQWGKFWLLIKNNF